MHELLIIDTGHIDARFKQEVYQHTISQRPEVRDRSSTGQRLSMLCSLRIYKDRRYVCGHRILAEGVFVSELSGNGDFLVGRIVRIAIVVVRVRFLLFLCYVLDFKNDITMNI